MKKLWNCQIIIIIELEEWIKILRLLPRQTDLFVKWFNWIIAICYIVYGKTLVCYKREICWN